MKTTLILAASALLASCSVANPNDGDKIGQIAKVQTEGLVCKTTGILVTGKFGGGELKLTVPESLYEKVKHFNETQEFVKITYHRDFIASWCSNSSGNVFLDTVDAHPAGAA